MFGISAEDIATLRETIAFELAYGSVRDEARAFAHRVDMAIIRRKIKATKIARAIYGASKGFLGLAVGDPLKTHVSDMKRALIRPRRRKVTVEAEKK